MRNRLPAPRVSLVLFLLLGAIAWPLAGSAAGSDGLGAPQRPGDVRAGTLLLDDGDVQRPAPTVATDVEIRVTGMIARTRVVQRFPQSDRRLGRGVYVFPLPDRAAVDTLTLRVGDRILEGEIHTRTEGPRPLRTRQGGGSEGDAPRTGAAQPLHQPDREPGAPTRSSRSRSSSRRTSATTAGPSTCASRWWPRPATCPAWRPEQGSPGPVGRPTPTRSPTLLA